MRTNPLIPAATGGGRLWISHGGERYTVAQWAARLGLTPQAVYKRLRNGTDATAPPHRRLCPGRRALVIEHRGLALPIKEWATILDVPARRIYQRLRCGWAPADALLKPSRQYRPKETRA